MGQGPSLGAVGPSWAWEPSAGPPATAVKQGSPSEPPNLLPMGGEPASPPSQEKFSLPFHLSGRLGLSSVGGSQPCPEAGGVQSILPCSLLQPGKGEVCAMGGRGGMEGPIRNEEGPSEEGVRLGWGWGGPCPSLWLTRHSCCFCAPTDPGPAGTVLRDTQVPGGAPEDYRGPLREEQGSVAITCPPQPAPVPC